MKQSIGRFFLRVFSIGLFLVVTGMAVFFAYGYRIDVDEGSVQKTSIIDIPAPRLEAQVYLDGQLYGKSLPIQLKGVLPGEHDVIVRKEEFISWSRAVEVKEDVVSLVWDVLLVPSDLTSYITEVSVFEEDQSFIQGKEYLLAFAPGANTVRAIVFAENGFIVDEEISLYKGGFEVVRAFSDERLFLEFENNSYAILGLDNQSFELFSLPPTVENVTIDIDGRKIYFLESGSLYALSVDDALEDRQFTFDPEQYQHIHDHVEHFVVSSSGDLFFSSIGMLYHTDRENLVFNLVEREPASVQGISLTFGKNYDLMMVQHHDKTLLFAVTKEGMLLEINQDIIGEAFISDEDTVLYTNSERVLHSYDIRKEVEQEIRVLAANETVLGWFDGFGHYLYQQDQNILTADIYNSNNTVLLENIQPLAVFVKDRAIFWLDPSGERGLMRLFWEE